LDPRGLLVGHREELDGRSVCGRLVRQLLS
jgi:hypothetical protein